MTNAKSSLPLLALAVAACCACGAPARVVYVVRHAEKAVSDAQPKDPPLTAQGSLRANALVQAIRGSALVAVYSTPFARTKSTAAPCASAAGLAVTEYQADNIAGLAQKVRGEAKGDVLIVGHSNTVPKILKALGVTEPVSLNDDDFGDLFVVTLSKKNKATMERKRFGDSPVMQSLPAPPADNGLNQGKDAPFR